MSVRSVLSTLVFGKPVDLKAINAAAIPFNGSGSGGRQYSWDSPLPSTRINYAEEAGDLSTSSVVMACIGWITRTFPEAPIEVKAGLGPDAEVVPEHALTALLATPNDFYSGLLLWSATLSSFILSGNAYWLKVRGGDGRLLQLWYEPHFTISPTWDTDGKAFINGYQILRGGKPYQVGVNDVVHFRYGIDPRNPRLGLSPLASALREVYTDNEGSNYSASILRNMGVPGLVVSPGTPDAVLTDPTGLKRDLLAKTSGDQRGQPFVSGIPIKIERMAWNPVEMQTREVRRIPEERISALIGIPAVVVGLGAGLDRSTFSNQRDAREAAYESCIVPTQRLLAAELDTQLLPDIGDSETEHVGFDLTHVRALQEDQDKLTARNVQAFRGGLIRRSEGRKALGYETTPEDDLFFTDLITRAERITELEPAGTLIPDLGPEGQPVGTPTGADTGKLLAPVGAAPASGSNGHKP